jgi:uncharacterized membrane protein YfcA
MDAYSRAMLSLKGWLLLALVAVSVSFIYYWWRRLAAAGTQRTSLTHLAIGAVTNFFDTLGIGSFATTTALYKLRGLVADELIPGTLNVGHTLPTFAQALIYITIVQVDPLTLVLMIAASVLGSWLGAGFVSRWPRRQVQTGMGLALIAAATLMLLGQLGVTSAGGEALALAGPRLWIGLVGNFALGALMTLGIGLYAPCLILVSLLGMVPTAAFPIMMGSCAFLMPVASLRFIDRARYSAEAAIGLALGGIPAVLLAAYVVRSLPLGAVRWLVIVVVVYTAAMMLRSAIKEARPQVGSLETPAAMP